MAEWKKIVVNASDNNTLSGSFTGSFTGDGSGLTGLATSLDIIGDSGTDTVDLINNDLSFVGTANEIETTVTDNQVQIGLTDNIDIAGTLDVTNAATFDNNVIIAGDLTVTGTTTQLQVTNLNVEDKFILLNSHSGDTPADGGIIVQFTSSADGDALGTSLFYDNDTSRWALVGSASNAAWDATDLTPDQYVVSVEAAAGVPSGNPSDFGTTADSRYGMMYVDTSDTADGGLYIYLPS